MLLAIDIGNTNITLGLYDGDHLRAHWRLSTEQHRMADEYGLTLFNLFQHVGIRVDDVHAVALASVVPPLTGASSRLIPFSDNFSAMDSY